MLLAWHEQLLDLSLKFLVSLSSICLIKSWTTVLVKTASWVKSSGKWYCRFSDSMLQSCSTVQCKENCYFKKWADSSSNFGVPERFSEKSLRKVELMSDIVLSILLHSYFSFSGKYPCFKYICLSFMSFSKRNLTADFVLTLSNFFKVFISPVFYMDK